MHPTCICSPGLYLLTLSNIPFEPDPQRLGGEARETSDEYWIQLVGRHGLKRRVVDASDANERLIEAAAFCVGHFTDAA